MNAMNDIYQVLMHARAFKQTGEHGRAIALLEAAVARGVESSDLYRELGELYSLQGEYGCAEKRLLKALQLCPADPWALFKLGLVHKMRGEYARGIVLFKKLKGKGPVAAGALKELGELYYRTNRRAAAIGSLQKALARDPGNGAARHFLALAYYDQGLLNESAAMHERALECGYATDESTEKRARAYYMSMIDEIGRWKNRPQTHGRRIPRAHARKTLRTARELVEDGRQCMAQGDMAGGLRRFRQAIEKGFGESDVYYRNMAVNEIEITEKKTLLESKPQQLWVTLTNRCNLACTMCSQRRQKRRDLPQKTVEEVARLFPYLERVNWLGGEVFLYPHFDRLLEEAGRHRHLRQVVTTNGLLIDDAWADRLTRHGVDICYSIDSADKDTYEAIRRNAKFEDLLKSIARVKKYRKKNNSDTSLVLNFVVLPDNYREIETMHAFARKHGFTEVTFLMQMDCHDRLLTRADNERLKQIYRKMTAPGRADTVKLNFGFVPADSAVFYKEPADLGGAMAGCTAREKGGGQLFCSSPWKKMIIDLHEITVECFCRQASAHYAGESLADLWNGPFMRAYRQKLLRGRRDWCDSRCTHY